MRKLELRLEGSGCFHATARGGGARDELATVTAAGSSKRNSRQRASGKAVGGRERCVWGRGSTTNSRRGGPPKVRPRASLSRPRVDYRPSCRLSVSSIIVEPSTYPRPPRPRVYVVRRPYRHQRLIAFIAPAGAPSDLSVTASGWASSYHAPDRRGVRAVRSRRVGGRRSPRRAPRRRRRRARATTCSIRWAVLLGGASGGGISLARGARDRAAATMEMAPASWSMRLTRVTSFSLTIASTSSPPRRA